MKRATKQKESYLLFDLVYHSNVELQLNPSGSIPPRTPIIITVKPKKPIQVRPFPSHMSEKLYEHLAGTESGHGISIALNNNLLQMGKLSNSAEECDPVNGTCLHAFHGFFEVPKHTYFDNNVGNVVDVVVVGSARRAKSNAAEFEVINPPLEAEVGSYCSCQRNINDASKTLTIPGESLAEISPWKESKPEYDEVRNILVCPCSGDDPPHVVCMMSNK